MAEKGSALEKPSREVVITRLFDAAPALVFKAWTDPKRMAQWFGPKGFSNPVCEIDARVGGAWHIVMRAPDGQDYPCGGIYREVLEPERLAFTNIATDKDGKPVIDGFTTVDLRRAGRQDETDSANARHRSGGLCSRISARHGNRLVAKPGALGGTAS